MQAALPPAPGTDYARSLLVTDLYQLNMGEAYLASGMNRERAVFELFFRRLAPSRGFLIAAGLEQAVRFVLEARVSPEELDWLRSTGRFSDRLLDFLGGFRFSGDVHAVPEGTAVFADEPVIRVTGPIVEAQLLETRLINFLHYQTMVATKAARMKLAAGDADIIDFGLRRAHSGEAGTLAARAAWIAGFAGTASLSAARLFDLPVSGTMAHSWVQAHESEREAFLRFARARPEETVFLLDTYDVERAARIVAEIAPELAQEGIRVRGVRIDSGDLGAGARKVREILDAAGQREVRIIASGGIDEHGIAELTAEGAPIDAWGVGTSLVTSSDRPSIDCVYKLKAYADRPLRKLSQGKSYWPCPTQIYRRLDADGLIAEDVIMGASEPAPEGPDWTPLLRPIIREGRLVEPPPPLEAARRRAVRSLASLPEPLRRLRDAPDWRPKPSAHLQELAATVDRRLAARVESGRPGGGE